jgi:hypothetical protein
MVCVTVPIPVCGSLEPDTRLPGMNVLKEANAFARRTEETFFLVRSKGSIRAIICLPCYQIQLRLPRRSSVQTGLLHPDRGEVCRGPDLFKHEETPLMPLRGEGILPPTPSFSHR